MQTSCARLLALSVAATMVLGPAAISAEGTGPEREVPPGGKPWQPQRPAQASETDETEAAEKSPFADWDEFTAETETTDGLFTLHQKREDLYLELQPDDFDRDFLIALSISRGIGTARVVGGATLNTALVNFLRTEDHVLLVEPNTRFTGGTDPALQQAVELSYGHSVLYSFSIESENQETDAVLIDIGRFLRSDFSDVGFYMEIVLDTGVSMDKDRSRIARFANYPENLEVDVAFTFNPRNRRELRLNTVVDNRYIPIGIHYSISALPENDYVPRLADSRVGYFVTAQKDFSNDSDSNYFVRYMNRWHLVKADSAAAVSDPVTPIVYYVDHTVPEVWRPYVKAGIEAWQPAFEAVGFTNAIVAMDPPDDPDFNPEDVRYSTIRWITSDEPAFGATGPSRVDPRTGQILDADILVEDIMVQSFRRSYTRYVNTRALATAETVEDLYLDPVLKRLMQSGALGDDARGSMCTVGQGFAAQAALLPLTLLAQGAIGPGDEVPIEYIGEGLTWVIMHEVGHTLGLRHNFKSSVEVPLDKLNDREYVARNGMTGSVMDYATANIDPDPAKQGYYYGPGLGTYDYWAITYGYTPHGATTPEDEKAELMAVAARSPAPGHTYATDEDTYPAGACDPGCNIFDLSSDPVGWAERQLALTDRLIDSPTIESMFLNEGDDYAKLRGNMNAIFGSRFSAMAQAYKYFGGAHVSRDHYGTPGSAPPVSPVTRADQQRAFDLVVRSAFRDEAFQVSAEVLDRLALSRWSHWGTSAFSPSESYLFPIHGWAYAFQASAVNNLLSPYRLWRMQEAEYKWDDVMSMASLFDGLTTEIWREVKNRDRDISSFRRSAQRAHLNRLTMLAANPPGVTPADAQALARMHLGQLDTLIESYLKAVKPDDYVRAHLADARAAIDRALDVDLVRDL